MKLFAIKNEKTGEYYMEPDRIIPDKDEVFAATTKEWAVFIRRLEDMKDTHEIISFCIEPTEPCEFCRDPDDLIVARYKPRKPGDPDPMMVAVEALDPELCPMCGRRLT